MTEDDLQSIVKVGSERAFAPGSLIFANGELASSAFLILEGSVRLAVKRYDGTDLTFETIQSGIFGEVAVLTNSTRTATAYAEGPTRVVEVRAEAFRSLLESNAGLRSEVLRQMAERLGRSAIQLQHAADASPASLADQPPTLSQIAIDATAKAVGTPAFIVVVGVLIVVWIEVCRSSGNEKLDPGFADLALLLSFLSMAATAIVLNSQNRSARLAAKRAQVEFDANILTQRQTEALHDRFTQLLERLNP